MKVNYDEPLSNFAFNFNLRRYTKHCRACDKCVLHFDHHCKWLNNCVGSKNYHSFFILVSTTLFQVLAQMAAGSYLLWWAVTAGDTADDLLSSHRYPIALDRTHCVAAMCVYLLAGAALCYLVGELFFFHVILMHRGITTYDYILGERDNAKGNGASGGSGAGGRAWRVLPATSSTHILRPSS